MKKFRVHLNAVACASVTVEASSPTEAFLKAMKETDGYAEAEFMDWDASEAEVCEEESDQYFLVQNGPDGYTSTES